MRLLFLTPLAMLAACNGAPVAVPSGPAVIADATILDEKALTGLELAYKAARIAVETGVDAGLIRGETAARFSQADATAYAALGVARSAYRAGNSTEYATAIANADKAVRDLLALTEKDK